MWKFRDLILKGVDPRKVLNKATISASTALVAYLGSMGIVEGLAKAGIAVTIDQSKLDSFLLVALAGVGGGAWNWFMHRIWKQRDNQPEQQKHD